jgi:hypothetical protein
MGTHVTYDTLRVPTVLRVAELMAAAAITAPKSGGMLFLAGKPIFGGAALTAVFAAVLVAGVHRERRPQVLGAAIGQPRATAARVIGLALQVAVLALLVDVYLY